MKIEIFSDIACPFCYIGKKRLEKVLKDLKPSFPEGFEIVYKSYQLDPSYHYQAGDTALSYLEKNKQIPRERVEAMFQQLKEMGQQAGVLINLDNNLPSNTLDAHRLLKWAQTKNASEKLLDLLFQAHFEQGLLVEDHKVLIDLAEFCNLDPIEAKVVLSSDKYLYEVNQDIMEARNFGVTGVPFFIFNERVAFSGAQAEEHFIGAIKQATE